MGEEMGGNAGKKMGKITHHPFDVASGPWIKATKEELELLTDADLLNGMVVPIRGVLHVPVRRKNILPPITEEQIAIDIPPVQKKK